MKAFIATIATLCGLSTFVAAWSFIWVYAQTPDSLIAFALLGFAICAGIATILISVAASEYRAPRRVRRVRR